MHTTQNLFNGVRGLKLQEQIFGKATAVADPNDELKGDVFVSLPTHQDSTASRTKILSR
jgi:hypothetical protein